MIQIFDWLREQIGKRTDGFNSIAMIDVNRVHDIIDEAEAKWESECCEWHYAKGGYYKTVVASPHKEFISLKTSDLKSQPYCGHCGKRIKISEVE